MDTKLLEKMITKVLDEYKKNNIQNNISVGVSARHVHLCRKDIDILFGKNYKLNILKKLMADEYAAKEQIAILGNSHKFIEKVRILGPLRKHTQVEISRTDAFFLKLNNCPVRESGDLLYSSPITLIGPKGFVKLNQGCIISNRHIHMNFQDALVLKLKNNDRVNIITNTIKKTAMYDVQVRVEENFNLEMHIDTDDANACGLKSGDKVTILKK